MKKIILPILLISCTSISFAQQTYQYHSSKNNKTLLNIADSSEIILTTESKNRHTITSNKHEYTLSREKSVWHVSDQAASDTIGAVSYKKRFKVLLNGDTFTRETSRNEWTYFKDGHEVLKLNIERKSGDRFISVQRKENNPVLELIALRDAALKIEASATTPVIIGAIAAAAILRALSNSEEY